MIGRGAKKAAPSDAVTDREIKGLYSRAERDTALRLYAAMEADDVVRQEQIITGSLGRRDAILVAERVRPVYTEAQAWAAAQAYAAIERRDFDAADAEFARGDVDVEDMTLMHRLGLLDPYLRACIEPVPVAQPEKAQPAVVDQAPPAHPVPAAGPTGTSTVRLPDGTDLTDPVIQARVAARVHAQRGEHAVVMWPRYPDVVDGVDPLVPIIDSRPCSTGPLPLGPTVKPTDAPRVAAQMAGAGVDIVEFSPRRGYAVGARLTDVQRTIRDRLATIVQRPSNPEDLRPWEVEVAVHQVPDDDGRLRLDQVVILRMQESSAESEKRLVLLRALIRTLPGGSDGWEVIDDLVTGVARLRFGKPRTLPGRVPMADLLPEAIDTSTWWRIPLGLDPAGHVACVDLTNGPHSLVVGPTGSGKSVYLRQHAASALAHGHQLVVIDPIKGGLDFGAFRPWCLAFGDDTIEQARVLIEHVYAEGMRRKALLRAYGAPSWVDLPPEVRRAEAVAPLTVIFDEFMSAAIASPVPKGIAKDDPLVEEAILLNAAKASIVAMIGKTARELRFTGVFLVIAMQRPDASLLAGFGEIRSNLTSTAQLVKPGSVPAQETLRMVFPGEQTQAAAETIVELDDGSSKGLATIAADGGDVQGFRVGFGEPSEVPALLEALGVPKPTPWTIASEGGTPQEGGVIITPPGPIVPIVRDLGEIQLSLDDLDLVEFVEVEADAGSTGSLNGGFDRDALQDQAVSQNEDEISALFD